MIEAGGGAAVQHVRRQGPGKGVAARDLVQHELAVGQANVHFQVLDLHGHHDPGLDRHLVVNWQAGLVVDNDQLAPDLLVDLLEGIRQLHRHTGPAGNRSRAQDFGLRGLVVGALDHRRHVDLVHPVSTAVGHAVVVDVQREVPP